MDYLGLSENQDSRGRPPGIERGGTCFDATMDRVMIYAKVYPRKMIEEYHTAMRGV
jgi:hypothetical protein